MNTDIVEKNAVVDFGLEEQTDFSLLDSMEHPLFRPPPSLISFSTKMEPVSNGDSNNSSSPHVIHPSPPRCSSGHPGTGILRQQRQQQSNNHKSVICKINPCSEPDPLELVLLHDEFPKVIELTGRIKQAQHYVVTLRRPTHPEATRPLDLIQVQSAVTRLQTTLVRPHHFQTTGQPLLRVTRGSFPMMDKTMDHVLRNLQNQWDGINRWIAQQKDRHRTMTNNNAQIPRPMLRRSNGTSTTQNLLPTTTTVSTSTTTSKKKEAIAIKYSKAQTDILMQWMIDHKVQPFPTKTDIAMLMQQTGLAESQVVNWTTNVRKRNRKATCEGGKKPHHFIDFLFLLQARETQEQQGTHGGAAGSTATTVKVPLTLPKSRGRVDKAFQLTNSSSNNNNNNRSRRAKNPKKTTKASTKKRGRSARPVPITPVSSRSDMAQEDGNDDDISQQKYQPVQVHLVGELSVTNDRLLLDFSNVWLRNGSSTTAGAQHTKILRTVTEDTQDNDNTDDNPLMADLCEMYDFSMLYEEGLEKDWDDNVTQQAQV